MGAMHAAPTALGAARRILEADRKVHAALGIAAQRPDLVAEARRRLANEVREAATLARALHEGDALRVALERTASAHDAWQAAPPHGDEEDARADEYANALFALARVLRGGGRRRGVRTPRERRDGTAPALARLAGQGQAKPGSGRAQRQAASAGVKQGPKSAPS